jgi:hypothetical protein
MLRRLAIVVAALAAVLAPVARATDRAPIGGLEGVPALPHVFTIVLENSNFDATWNGGVPYLSELKSKGAFLPNYYGTGHASADNYITMTSGQPPTPLFMGDCENWSSCVAFERAWPDGGRNITDQIDEAGLTWRAYMESMPGPCTHPSMTDVIDPYSAPYATRHNPFAYYPSIIDDQAYCDAHVVPYTTTAFQGELADHASAMPNYVFITPDTCSDGHDSDSSPVPVLACKDDRPGGLASVETWLRANVPPILDYIRSHGGALIITLDENGFSDPDCCTTGGAFGGRIGTLVLGPRVASGEYPATYDHYGLLRTIEDAFGIAEHLNLAALDIHPPINDIWIGARP